jgi:hypothetical protein
MSRHAEEQQSSAQKTRRQQEDLRRMQFRRAIEDYSEQRRLNAQLAELASMDFMAPPPAPRRNARTAH